MHQLHCPSPELSVSNAELRRNSLLICFETCLLVEVCLLRGQQAQHQLAVPAENVLGPTCGLLKHVRDCLSVRRVQEGRRVAGRNQACGSTAAYIELDSRLK